VPRRDPAQRLATPAAGEARRISPPRLSPDSFGRFAEGIARYLGTAKFLIIQTFVIVVWILFTELVFNFDKYPYVLLTLALSMQASYAAPLILLAQNRQEDRDREALERDRDDARRTQQDTEYLARELASIRIALADVATAEDLERSLERILDANGAARKKAKKKKRLDDAALDDPPHQQTSLGPAGPDNEEDDSDEPASPS